MNFTDHSLDDYVMPADEVLDEVGIFDEGLPFIVEGELAPEEWQA